VREIDDTYMLTDLPISLDADENEEAMVMTEGDIYKELRLRGYNYKYVK